MFKQIIIPEASLGLSQTSMMELAISLAFPLTILAKTLHHRRLTESYILYFIFLDLIILQIFNPFNSLTPGIHQKVYTYLNTPSAENSCLFKYV